MANWQEELDKKFKQLNIKEETNETKSVSKNRSNSSRSNNSVSSSKHTSDTSNTIGDGSRDLFRGRVSEKTRYVNNVKKGGNRVITKEAALDDLEKMEVEAKDEVSKVVIKVAKVLVKILSTIRSNQLLTDEEKKNIKEARAKREVK